MKLTFYGAAREVTGSCYLVEACGKKLLVDCGMQQGGDEKGSQELPFSCTQVDYVLATHAHIDHTGRLPLLAKNGFSGKILATGATADLCRIMLRDSAHIQESDAEYDRRKALRAGRTPPEPLYTAVDAEAAIRLFEEHDYNEEFELCGGIRARFTDAGHLLGSASIELWIDEAGVKRKLVFSGDIGNLKQPLIRDPQYVSQADYVLVESTYGDRVHDTPPDYAAALAEVIQRTFDRGGNLVVPSFAVGRTQELLYFIRHIKERGLVKGYDGFRVYVDSPLANEATNVFTAQRLDCFDEEALELVKKGINPISFDGLVLSLTSDDSKRINSEAKQAVIISAAGMCNAGRIRHHLKYNLWKKESTVAFVGYQAPGTLGRILLDGVKKVKILGDTINVSAEIVRLDGISGHADQKGLLKWLAAFTEKPTKVFVTHGDDDVAVGFAKLVAEKFGFDAEAPLYLEQIDLVTGAVLCPGENRVKQTGNDGAYEGAKNAKSGAMERKLYASLDRLRAVIKKNLGAANEELESFSSEIDALCDRWDR